MIFPVPEALGSIGRMPALINEPLPVEFIALLERRRALGQDKLDEVWDGVYHMNPDGALFRTMPDAVFLPTAALVVEIVSPGDETWNKLDFYAAHEADEFLIVDKQERRVHWLGLTGGTCQPISESGLIELGPDELAARIDWP